MNLNIRVGNKTDVPELFRLVQAHADEDYDLKIQDNSVEKMTQEFGSFKSAVAECDNQIVGMVLYSFTYRSWRGEGFYIDDIFVEKKFRNLGIGTQLMKFVMEDAEAQNFAQLYWLTAEENHKGRALYQKIGADITPGKCDCRLNILDL